MNGQRIAGIALSVVAIAAVVYHMVSAYVMLQQFIPLLNTHLAFALVMVFLSGFIKAKGKSRFWCLLLLFLSLMISQSTESIRLCLGRNGEKYVRKMCPDE